MTILTHPGRLLTSWSPYPFVKWPGALVIISSGPTRADRDVLPLGSWWTGTSLSAIVHCDRSRAWQAPTVSKCFFQYIIDPTWLCFILWTHLRWRTTLSYELRWSRKMGSSNLIRIRYTAQPRQYKTYKPGNESPGQSWYFDSGQESKTFLSNSFGHSDIVLKRPKPCLRSKRPPSWEGRHQI